MRACCEDEQNLCEQPPDPKAPPNCVVRVCVVCGARHIEVTVDPIRFGVQAPGLR